MGWDILRRNRYLGLPEASCLNNSAEELPMSTSDIHPLSLCYPYDYNETRHKGVTLPRRALSSRKSHL